MIYYNLADQGFKSSARASVGVYNVSVQMALNLAEEMPCAFLIDESSQYCEQIENAETRVVKAGTNGFRRVAWDQWGLYTAVGASRSDWLFLPKGFSAFARKPPCKLAVYIHDVVYAYWRRAYPGYRSRLLHTYFDLGLKASLRHADVIFSNSEFTADEIRRFADRIGYKNLPPIVTAGIGFDHLLDAPCEEERNGILVYVSSWPHKASVALLEKLKRWQHESGFSEPVYFLGTFPQGIECSIFSNWILLDTLPELEYRVLLGRVRCSVFNSEYEGFGMPPGESLIQGAAPVYSSIPTLNEVMNGSGFPYDNGSYESFADALDSARSVRQDLLTEWKQDFRDRHNWSKVIGNIKAVLEGKG